MEAEALTTQDLTRQILIPDTEILDTQIPDTQIEDADISDIDISEAEPRDDTPFETLIIAPAAGPDSLADGPSADSTQSSEIAVVAAKTFDEFGIATEICSALSAAGITAPFPIQALTMPIALDGHDVIGQARTGTGKTLAFGIPVLERILTTGRGKPSAPRALVVVPTRELAIQVADDLRTAAARSDVNVVTLYGGRAYEPQIEALATVDVVVGTPGRLLDLARQRQLDLSDVEALVLDEADRMLDLGFLPDVEAILRLTPLNRQTMLFSATMPAEVVTLARRHLHRPTHIRAEEHDEPAHVPSTDQHVLRAHHLDKIEVLARVLQARNRGLTIVFCRTRRAVDQATSELAHRGFATASVHGDLGQSQRERALRAFRSGKIDVLVATDVAARGLDVDDVTHVINYECPEDDKAYLHRIGRTARAGRTGVAVTFVDWQDLTRWKLINETLKLGHPEPVETYSTSEHLFTDLDIPAGVTGSLPRAARERAGLEAEALEDIGETGKTRSRQRQPNGTGHNPRSRTSRAGTGEGAGPSDRGNASSSKRPRRRTRAGIQVDSPDAPATAPAATPTAAAETAPTPEPAGQAKSKPSRRRRRSSHGSGARPATAVAGAEAAPDSTRPATTAELRDIAAG
jgi:superfamily II DNA/RNA helicase